MPQIWNISFDSILWFLAGGQSFFWGTALLSLAVFLSNSTNRKSLRITYCLLQIPMLLMIILSATPLHPIFYILWAGIFIACQIRTIPEPWKCFTSRSFIIFCVIAISLELPWHIKKNVTITNPNPIIIIGDSISAGLGNKNEKTWPKRLTETTGIQTINLAKAGATVSSALKKQVPQVPTESGLVIIEIGGNDFLNFNCINTFYDDSDKMLKKLQSARHQVVWIELPLLPQYYSYGRVQRKLARKYNITLIPKSVLVSIFCTRNATSDGMHLTSKGHELMAQNIQQIIQME